MFDTEKTAKYTLLTFSKGRQGSHSRALWRAFRCIISIHPSHSTVMILHGEYGRRRIGEVLKGNFGHEIHIGFKDLPFAPALTSLEEGPP